MATASTSGQSTFGLGRKKKNPGVMDQITKFFGGGDKKKRSKVSAVLGSFFLHNFSKVELNVTLCDQIVVVVFLVL